MSIIISLFHFATRNDRQGEIQITRKCGNCECIATWGPLTPRQSFRFNYDAGPANSLPLLSYGVFTVIMLRFDLGFWSCDLDLWPLTLNITSVSPMTWWNSVPNFSEIEQSAAKLLWFQCFTLWPWTCFTCWGMLWYKVSVSQSLNSVNLFVRDVTIFLLVTLTFDPLTLKFYSTSHFMCSNCLQNLNEIE